MKWPTNKHNKGDSVYMVRLKVSPLLQVIFEETNDWFKQVLPLNRSTEDSNKRKACLELVRTKGLCDDCDKFSAKLKWEWPRAMK